MAMHLIKLARNWLLRRAFQSVATFQGTGLGMFQIGVTFKVLVLTLALPGPETGLSSKVFYEAMTAHLCLSSPAVVSGGWVGKNTVRGGALIDQFGDAFFLGRLPFK